MAKVYILCGKVASGKTTLATRLAEKGAMVLSCDELMLTLFDHCLGPQLQRETESRALRFLQQQAAALYSLGVDAVLDHGFWYREDRQRALAYFRGQNIPAVLYHVTAPQEVRLARLERRNKQLQGSGRREYVMTPDMLTRFDTWFEPLLPVEQAVKIETGQEETTYCDGKESTGGNPKP